MQLFCVLMLSQVRAKPDNAPAWRLLGTVHAENDDDRQAIAALQRAMKADPENLDVLLALGVSHTNELDAGEALGFLRRWISTHPTYHEAAATAGPAPDSSQALSHTVRLFERVLAGPGATDPELHLALGVLHHLDRRYEGAIKSFHKALELRPVNYRLVSSLFTRLWDCDPAIKISVCHTPEVAFGVLGVSWVACIMERVMYSFGRWQLMVKWYRIKEQASCCGRV
eukprot:GHUV01036350.1.p1 GENE.GHUV01036350.1~~GHUV01036350.1.p1  ORF type:complete len:227 (+),score=23.50 GHUV01036350.1:769-1449(+)